MKRSWNGFIWLGFAVVLLAAFSILFLIQFPAIRDFPWPNLLLFAAGGVLLAIGLKRAFLQPDRYRGKVSGVILGLLSLALFGLFWYGAFVLTADIPSASGAPRTGTPAPDFTLSDAAGLDPWRSPNCSRITGLCCSFSTVATGESSATPSYGVSKRA